MKLIASLLLALTSLSAQVTLTSSSGTFGATAGQTITITSSSPVTFSCTGSGTCTNTGVSGQTSMTITAPASVPPKQTMLGCPVAPNDSIFDTPITNVAVDSRSAGWISQAAPGTNLQILPSWGVTYADSSTPTKNLTPSYGDGTGAQPTWAVPFPGRTNLKRENGNYTSGSLTQNDHHVIIVNRSTCKFFEYYNEPILMFGAAEFSQTYACHVSGSSCNVQSEIPPYTPLNYYIPGGYYGGGTTDAAGLPLAPLTWTLADIKAGPKHRTRFTTNRAYINNTLFLWPTAFANGYYASAAPYGSMWRLKSSFNVTSACTPSGGSLNPDCYNMLTALQTYGMELADIGGYGNTLTVSSDVTEDPVTRAAISLIASAGISPAQFDIVCGSAEQVGSSTGNCSSSLQETAANGYQIASGEGSYAVDPLNSWVAPTNYAAVKATPSSGSAVTASVAFQGVGLGLMSNVLPIVAGTPAYQIQSWVTPASANQTVTWVKTSSTCSGDSVTSGGSYTAPASTSSACSAVLTATATADSSVHQTVNVYVLQYESSTLANIGLDLNSSAPTTSYSGARTWNADQGCEVSTPNYTITSDYPTWGGNEVSQYSSVLYTYGGDVSCSMVLPNGNYEVRIMQGTAWNGAAGYPPHPAGSTQGMVDAPQFTAINGVIESNFYDWNYLDGYQFATPTDLYVPAKVTNNRLFVQVMGILPDSIVTAASGIGPLYPGVFPNLTTAVCNSGCSKTTQISAIEVLPYSAPAHWEIDLQRATTISPGQSIQLYLVDWFTGLNDPTWAISGPTQGATISSTGLLSMPASASMINGQILTVTASDGSYTVARQLTTVGGISFIN